MHAQGPPYFPHMTAPMAEALIAVDVVDVVDAVNAAEAVLAVEAVEAVDAAIATRVSAPIAKLTAILQMYAEVETRSGGRKQ